MSKDKGLYDMTCSNCEHWEVSEFINLGTCKNVMKENKHAYLIVPNTELLTTFDFYCKSHGFRDDIIG
jgi:hypothetical protein